MEDRYRTVIVGTGFGGSVLAYRLAKAEGSVCVLERGRRYGRADFPSSAREITFWDADRGLIDFHGSPEMDVVQAAGVGGGSLIYANVHLRAEERVLGDWPGGLDRAALEPCYDRVAAMLGVTPFPGAQDVTKNRVLAEAARRSGREATSPPLAVYFGERGEEKDDPYDRGGPPQTGCTMCGRCVTGCPHHAKNTLDLNYLHLAEHAHGAEVHPLHEALSVAPADGGYTVRFRDHESGREGTVTGDRVVLSAGSLGSTALLLRSRAALPSLSPALGRRFSPNGDFLAGAVLTDEAANPTVGPTITTMVKGGPDLIVEDGGFPEFMAWYARAFYPDPGALRRLARFLWLRFVRRLFVREPLNTDRLLRDLFHGTEPPAARGLPFLSIGLDAADGRLELDERERLVVRWSNRARRNRSLWKAMERETGRLARGMGGHRVLNPLWSLARKLITVHPLGGCVMGESAETGVVSPAGEVFGHPGLFVADGAVIPTAIGVNPAMTIAAVAEHIADGLVDGGPASSGDPPTAETLPRAAPPPR